MKKIIASAVLVVALAVGSPAYAHEVYEKNEQGQLIEKEHVDRVKCLPIGETKEELDKAKAEAVAKYGLDYWMLKVQVWNQCQIINMLSSQSTDHYETRKKLEEYTKKSNLAFDGTAAILRHMQRQINELK